MKITTILSLLLISAFLFCSFLYIKSFAGDIELTDCYDDITGNYVCNEAIDTITNTTEQKTLDDLVNITDGEITLKCSLGIPLSGFGTVTISKGTKITIGE